MLAFIHQSMKPERFTRCQERCEALRATLNLALAFAGLSVAQAGALESAEKATALSEAIRRAQQIRPNQPWGAFGCAALLSGRATRRQLLMPVCSNQKRDGETSDKNRASR